MEGVADVKNLRKIEGGRQPAHDAAGELAERIKALVYEYAGRMPTATAIGALEIAKMERALGGGA